MRLPPPSQLSSVERAFYKSKRYYCPVYWRKEVLQRNIPYTVRLTPDPPLKHALSGRELVLERRREKEYRELVRKGKLLREIAPSGSRFYLSKGDKWPSHFAFYRVLNTLKLIMPRSQKTEALLWEVDLNPSRPQDYQLRLRPGQGLDEDSINARFAGKMSRVPGEVAPELSRIARRRLALRAKEKIKIQKKMKKEGIEEGAERYDLELQKRLDAWDKSRSEAEERRAIARAERLNKKTTPRRMRKDRGGRDACHGGGGGRHGAYAPRQEGTTSEGVIGL